MFGFTFKQLRYIEAAARTGSIANAALELNISQSSITAAIDNCEQELGYELFIRVPAKGIVTTPSGEEAVRLIRGFIDSARHFDGDMRSVGGKTTGTLRIACYGTSAPQVLPRLLKHFVSMYPEISIKLLEGDMRMVMDFLENGDADIALTYDMVVPSHHHFAPLFQAPPHAVLQYDDPLANQPDVRLADLAGKPMVMLDLPHTREYFTKMFERLKLTPNIVHSTRSAEIARALVVGGFGFTILNVCHAEHGGREPGYIVRHIADRTRAPVFGIATLANARQPRIVQAFLEHCLDLKRQNVFREIVVQPT
jgi:DNA-binding transcriptional LysR family regulator